MSITQSFNTTTSMGRLTLNMLLSYAQFEREGTAERMRDKVAASKARGMWMGATPLCRKTQKIVSPCRAMARDLRGADQSAIAGLIDTTISKIDITSDRVTIILDQKRLGAKMQIDATTTDAPSPSIAVPVTLKRSGSALRMVLPSGESASPQVDDKLLTTIATAKQWWQQMLSNPRLRVTDLAAMHQVTESWVTRVLRLAFLDPRSSRK